MAHYKVLLDFLALLTPLFHSLSPSLLEKLLACLQARGRRPRDCNNFWNGSFVGKTTFSKIVALNAFEGHIRYEGDKVVSTISAHIQIWDWFVNLAMTYARPLCSGLSCTLFIEIVPRCLVNHILSKHCSTKWLYNSGGGRRHRNHQGTNRNHWKQANRKINVQVMS